MSILLVFVLYTFCFEASQIKIRAQENKWQSLSANTETKVDSLKQTLVKVQSDLNKSKQLYMEVFKHLNGPRKDELLRAGSLINALLIKYDLHLLSRGQKNQIKKENNRPRIQGYYETVKKVEKIDGSLPDSSLVKVSTKYSLRGEFNKIYNFLAELNYLPVLCAISKISIAPSSELEEVVPNQELLLCRFELEVYYKKGGSK